MSKIINEKEFNDLVLNSEKTVFVDFFSNTCIPCKMMAPIFESSEEKYKNKAEFFKVNVADNMQLALNYSVTSVPSILAIKDGKEKNRLVGACTDKEFHNFIGSSI